MEERLFLDKAMVPSDELICIGLANANPLYEKLKMILSRYSTVWIFTKSSGWMLKYHDNKKALLYFIPLRNEFKISLALRENEKKVILNENTLDCGILKKIESAKKYAEGYAIQLVISKNTDYIELSKLIVRLIGIRRVDLKNLN
jgi:hypothetical protein